MTAINRGPILNVQALLQLRNMILWFQITRTSFAVSKCIYETDTMKTTILSVDLVKRTLKAEK